MSVQITLYNTLTREKAAFYPIDDSNVRMYVCGPTVYDHAHIGNARPIIVFDQLFRILRHAYGASAVTYARNITDVDDKINARAAEEGVSIAEVTERTTAQFHADIAQLNALPPSIEPRATQHIEEMLDMIARLIETGHAYEAEGHVLFEVGSMANYGKLSGRSLDEMEAGARVEVAPYKKNPMDFVLWKPSKEGEPAWDSPYSKGRPGWHIECSAMSKAHLGEVFDIHGGGIDLVFPHHENEVAQSCCANGTDKMAQVWMHNGFLQVEGEKMSKSLGNFITINELLKEWPGEAVRLAMLATHYRQPFNWTSRGVADAKKLLDQIYQLTADVEDAEVGDVPDAMVSALVNDLNTPLAIAVLHELRSEAAAGNVASKRALLASARFIGVRELTLEAWTAWRPASVEVDDAKIAEMVAARNTAKAEKNWARADEIRDELAGLGIALKDGPDGTTWTAS